MGYYGTNLLTNGEHDSLWRLAFRSIPNIEKELNVMNRLKYVELLRDAGMSNENIRKTLCDLGKEVGYNVTFDETEE